uniref:Protein kinase domain-containing protein n=1 Tax=Setaria italica TaxID=4555 RepID=K3YZ20_SETIT
MAMAKLRERRQLSLSVVPPALPPPFTYQEHPFGGMDTTPPGSSGPVIESVAELEKVGVLGHGADGTALRVRDGGGAALREADVHLRVAAAAPDNPHVVRLHGVFPGAACGDEFLRLVLEYVVNGSLGDVLRRWAASREHAIAGVARCPSNLLVGRHGEVKIADFGATHHVSAAGRAHSEPAAMGTCAYMSPERLDPEGFGAGPPSAAADFSSDVWALGVVLLECHMGRFPLVAAGERPDWEALVVAVCFGGAPEVPVAATPEFRSFVRRCLEKDWRRRPTVEELLGHPFVSGSPAFCATKEWLTNFDEELTIVRKGFT